MNRSQLTTRIFREIGIIQERTDFLLKRGLPPNLPAAQFKLLNHLIYTTNHDETLSELAQNSHVSLSAMSQIIKQLVRKGYVTLHARETDARQKTIAITSQGRAAHGDALARVGTHFGSLAGRFGARELTQLHDSLQRFRLTFEETAETTATPRDGETS